MDFASLSRPAILCQCSKCSSSLAVLENEWAKLSNAYSLATGWLSVNFNRISVSTEKKQIPPTPDMHLLRGRTTQEVTCKLCQHKLGALCTLDNGPNIFWKMSRVAFREVVTMRTAEPEFKEGALERYLCPAPKEIPRRDRTSIHEGALVPKGGSDPALLDPTMQQHMQHQGRSIDQISNSVNHLQDTMTDLKHSFTALRIELNGPSPHLGENGNLNSHGFDMIATVLKELKSKSDEIEKLKLEIEALKLKNRFMEERKPNNPDFLSTMDGTLPEVKSPGLLQAGRKRAWPDAFSNDGARTVADSFGEEDLIEDLSLANPPTYLVSLPIGDSHAITNGENEPQHTANSPNFHVENNEQRLNPDVANQTNGFSQPSPSKRLRLTEKAAEESPQEPPRDRKRLGRPRQSEGQSTKPNPSQTPKTPSAGSEEASGSNPPVQVPLSNHAANTQPARRGRPRRSTRSRSTGSADTSKSQTAKSNGSSHDATKAQANGEPKSSKRKQSAEDSNADDAPAEDSTINAEEKRKAKVAARDVMTRVAMQREEAMETDEIR